MSDDVSNSRVFAVDALRGFALAGIVIAHMYEQFISAPRPTTGWSVEPNLADGIISGIVMMFVSGKFYSMFALLFGVSFAIMMDRADRRGNNFSGRFVWRLALLAVFGLGHAALYRGDILTAYVAIGFFLPLFYNISDRWLWALVILLVAGTGPYLVYLFIGKASFLPWEVNPSSPVVAEYVELLKTGSFTAIAIENLSHGLLHKFDFLFAVFGRGYLTFAYFLVGMWLVRSGIIYRLSEHKSLLKRTLWANITLTVIFLIAMFTCFALMPNLLTFERWAHVFAFSFYNFFNISFTLVLVAGFLLIYLRKDNSRLLYFAPYGRMALTNYILQSVLGTFFFFGWGLGMLSELHDWQTLLIAITLIAFQMFSSQLWLKHYKYGPLEWLWRCGTYMKWIPNNLRDTDNS